MICYKKIMMMCALSATVFACAMEENKQRIELIDAEIKNLGDQLSAMNQQLANRYGNSTVTYRAASKNSSSQFVSKIQKLEKEKAQLKKSQL